MANKRNGDPPANRIELIDEWGKYFEELLNNTNSSVDTSNISEAPQDLNIDTANFTKEELLTAIKSTKNNKSPGYDESITAEALKYGGDELHSAIVEITNSVLNQKVTPKQWLENIIIPIPKKASKSMKDFRGISLMSVAGKVYNKMLLNRIYKPIDNVLRPFQAGFRKGRNCLEQIHILRRLFEAYHQRQLPVIATFVDFSKVFDSVDRNALWKILRHYGIPHKITDAIMAMYTNSSSRVRLDNQFSKAFSINTGVLQGDTLAPFLFIIVLDYIF